jgi:bifunctional DNase/RNase
MSRQMVISRLALDSSTKNPIVILKEVDGERSLPIWIGLLEANAIASELEGVKFSRPMTHDLLKNMMDTLGIEVRSVEVSDLKNDTYYALIHIIHNGREISIDARPSDALALSLRCGAPIFASENAIDKSMRIDLQGEPEDTTDEGKRWLEILEKINPDDFGNT